MARKKQQTCIQCGETLDLKDNFYRIQGRRYQKRCKRCVSQNNKKKRDQIKSLITERTCLNCGQTKSIEDFQVHSHGNTHCLECISNRTQTQDFKLNDKTEDLCIICKKIKPRDQFKRLYKSGSKCIECVKKKEKLSKAKRNKSYYKDRIESGYVAKKAKCEQCKELKSAEHFNKIKDFRGLSKLCRECMALNRETTKTKKEARREARREQKILKKLQKSRDQFEKKLNDILTKYPNCCIMNEHEYKDGYVITQDLYIISITRKYKKRLSRKTEHLYFKYFAPNLSMCDYYYDFQKNEIIKFKAQSHKGRPSNNPNRERKIYQDKKSKDPIWRLKRSVTSSFCQWMKGTKDKSTWKYVDYTIKELKEHLESQFTEGMSWDNYGWDGWWIDHIIPRDQFDFKDPEQIKKCWKLSNLQPLWKMDNMAKGNKIVLDDYEDE
jgi:hypothetical protein